MTDLWTYLVLCGLMGLVGQGARAVITLGNSSILSTTGANQQTSFNAAYLTLSLIIGFIAGILAGLALQPTTGSVGIPDRQTLLGLIAAGYAGTDFIENTFAKLMPSVGNPAQPASLVTPPVGAPAPTDAAVQSLTGTIQALSSHVVAAAAQAAALAAAALPAGFDLAGALHKVLPAVDATTWLPALTGAFGKYDLNTPLRIAAAMGQFVAEVDSQFSELQENMAYTAAELLRVFPNEFHDQAMADQYAGNAEAIGNYVYANRNGNGDVASGDGYRFRGRGLIQLTGRNAYTEFAKAIGMDIDHVPAYLATAEGAAISGCWYFNTRGCLPLADQWRLTEITHIVNGGGMQGLATRIDYANRFRDAFGAPIPGS